MSLDTGVIDPRNMTLRVPRELVSPNRWNGRHWRGKHRISQDWQLELRYAGWSQALTWRASDHGRVRVSITREVPSGRNFIRDDDNLRFCVKPLLDALKRQGYIKNDSRKWIELPTPEQKISADGEYWTEIHLQSLAVSAPTAKAKDNKVRQR